MDPLPSEAIVWSAFVQQSCPCMFNVQHDAAKAFNMHIQCWLQPVISR